MDDEEKIAASLERGFGYNQTKFVTELIVKNYARKAGSGRIPVIKSGLIIGSFRTGVSNTDDFVWRVAARSVGVDGFNADERSSWITLAGVDKVAETVMNRCLTTHSASTNVVKLLDGISVNEFWDIIGKECHSELLPLSSRYWMRNIRDMVERAGETYHLYPFPHFLETKQGRLGGATASDYELQFTSEDAAKAVRKSVQYLNGNRRLYGSEPLATT